MADETVTVRRDGGTDNNGETVTMRRGDTPVGGETVTVQRGNVTPASGETVTVRRDAVPADGQMVTVRRDNAPANGETVTVRRGNAPAVGQTVTVPRVATAPASGETVTVGRPSPVDVNGETVTVTRSAASANGQTVTVPRGAAADGQTVTVPRGSVVNPNGETVTVSRGNDVDTGVLRSPFAPEDVTIVSNGGQKFIIHLGQVIGQGGQSVVVAAERVDDGLACIAKIFSPLAKESRREYQKVVSTVMSLGDRPVSQTHLLPIFAYLHQGLEATELGAVAPQLWDVSITPLATCLFDRPRSTHFVKSRVIPELSQAIELLHTELGIVHRDIKPANVYLYDKQIVLGDYGSARSIVGGDNRSTHTITRSDGYTPGHGGMVDPRNDWYSFGYTVWTLYERNVHPLHGFMSSDPMKDRLYERLETGEPVPFNHPDDATLGNLLQGLTFELSSERFGYEEIKDWIADPDQFYRKLPMMDAGSARKPYKFAGKSYNDPISLARALVSNWDEAKLRMSQKQLENLMAEWGENDLQTKIHQLVEEDIQTAQNPDLALACVIYEMSGGKIMSWRGEDVSVSDAPEALPARIAKMSNVDIDRYAVQSGLDGTASSGVLPSGFLSRIFSRKGEDSEVFARLARDTRDLEILAGKSKDPHFAACLFKGLLTYDEQKTRAAAQGEIGRLIASPRSFFATCSSLHAIDEFFLLFAGAVDMDSIIKAHENASGGGSIDVDVILDFMDGAADDKAAVRAFYRRFGKEAAWVWLAGHTELYAAAPGSKGEAAIIALRGLCPTSNASVSTLMAAGPNIRIEGNKLRDDMEVTPVPYINGWQVRDVHLARPLTTDALFCAQSRGETVPRGYVAELLATGVDEGLLGSIGIKLLARASLTPSAAYSQFLEDKRREADGALKGAIQLDTKDYEFTDGVADTAARIEVTKKEQGAVLRWTCIAALIYFVVIICARNAFGQFIVMCGSFGPLAVLFLVAAFVCIFGYLALNLLRSFSAVDRVQSLDNDLRSNAALFENRLVELAEFDERKGAVAERLSVVGPGEELPTAQGLGFSAGSPNVAFYADPAVMAKLAKLAVRLMLVAATVTSVAGFMGAIYIDGDGVAKFEVLLAALIDAVACVIALSDDAHPGSSTSIKTWSYIWAIPVVVAFLLWGVVSVLQAFGIVLAIIAAIVILGFFF